MAEFNFYITSKECKTQTREAMHGVWKTSATITIVYFLIASLLSAATVLLSVYVQWWLSIPLGIFSALVLSILDYGYSKYCLSVAQDKIVSVSILFSGFGKKMGQIIKISIKKSFLSVFWLILLIVPFFVKSIGYSMANFLLIDNPNVNGTNAIKESKHLLKKNYGRYFKFVLSFFWWFVLCGITGGIASLWVMPMFVVNKAMFYENLKTDF